jgi:hypothetical protein
VDVGRFVLPMQILFDLSAFVTFVAILFAVAMWATLWKSKFPVPVAELARIFTIAFCLQLLIYLFFSFFIVDIQVRMYLVRISIIVICLSQAVPLFVAYHAWRMGQK